MTTLPDSVNGGEALPEVVTSKAAEPSDPDVAHSATATTAEEVKPATISLPARMGTSSPTPAIDAFLSELGCPVVGGGSAGTPSGEESRGRKPMLQSHIELGTGKLRFPTSPRIGIEKC